MKRIIEYPFHLGDLVGGTTHLDNGEFGAYMRLLIAQIQSPTHDLPADEEQLRRFARCTPKAWASLWPLIRDKFPAGEEGRLSNKRVKITIDSIIHRSSVARDNRLKRKDISPTDVKPPSNGRHANHITLEDNTNVLSSPPTPQRGDGEGKTEVIVAEKGSPKTIMYGAMDFDAVFEYLWKEYPKIRDKGHKGQAREQLAKAIAKGGKNEDDYRSRARGIAEGVRRYARYCAATGEKNPDCFRWIRDEGFNRPWDVPAAGAGRSAGYSLEAVHDQAVADTTRRPEGREERLKRLGMGDDTSDD